MVYYWGIGSGRPGCSVGWSVMGSSFAVASFCSSIPGYGFLAVEVIKEGLFRPVSVVDLNGREVVLGSDDQVWDDRYDAPAAALKEAAKWNNWEREDAR